MSQEMVIQLWGKIPLLKNLTESAFKLYLKKDFFLLKLWFFKS